MSRVPLRTTALRPARWASTFIRIGSRLLTTLAVSFLLALFLSTSAAAQESDRPANHHLVTPSGTDDTAAIQAALDACDSAPTCVIEFAEGVFFARPLLSHGFTGTIRGAGSDASRIETLVAEVSDARPLLSRPPTLDAPWPYMLTMIDAHVRIEDLGFRVVQPQPTTGWHLFGFDFDAMVATILITGTESTAMIERVRVEGGPGTFQGSNLINGIYIEGILPDGTEPWTEESTLPLTGTFVVRESVFRNAAYPMATTYLVDSLVVIERNRFEPSPVVEGGASDIDLLDHIDTTTIIHDNEILDDSGFGIHIAQGSFVEVSGMSTFVIGNNRVRTSDGGTAILLEDNPLASGGSASARFVIDGNAFDVRGGGTALTATAAADVRIVGNEVTGSGGEVFVLGPTLGDDQVGIAERWVLIDNVLSGYTADGATIMLGQGVRDVVVVCGPGERVADPGGADATLVGCGSDGVE